MKEKINKAVEKSVIHTFDVMFDTKVEVGPMEELPPHVKSEEVCAAITFSGILSGQFLVQASEECATVLAKKMLGMPVEIGSDMMKDAFGEITNILVGGTKRFYESSEPVYTISTPLVVVGSNYEVYSSEKTSKVRIPCSFDKYTFFVDVILSES